MWVEKWNIIFEQIVIWKHFIMIIFKSIYNHNLHHVSFADFIRDILAIWRSTNIIWI